MSTGIWSSATGEIDFPPVLAALTDLGHRGLVSVEIQGGALDAPTSPAAPWSSCAEPRPGADRRPHSEAASHTHACTRV